MDTVPAYQRAGTILPLQMRPRRNSVLMHKDPYTLRIALDAKVPLSVSSRAQHRSDTRVALGHVQGEARGTLFMDDDLSYEYEAGAFAYRLFALEKGRLTSTSLDTRGTWQPQNRIERLVLLGWKSNPAKVLHVQSIACSVHACV